MFCLQLFFAASQFGFLPAMNAVTACMYVSPKYVDRCVRNVDAQSVALTSPHVKRVDIDKNVKLRLIIIFY